MISNSNKLCIIQLIDSLDSGGAERMAVNYANVLSSIIEFSGLVSTRNEGNLKEQILPSTNYFFLGKKHAFDIRALLKLLKYIKVNKVNIVHAHSSSYFFAVLVKIARPSIKILWHDHFGNRLNSKKNVFILKISSIFFNGVISVNEQLNDWAKLKLHCKNSIFLPNFSFFNDNYSNETFLNGIQGKRIVCLANLKNPKNHILLLKAFIDSNLYKNGWTIHLIGKDFNDSYSLQLKECISENNLQNSIFLYGLRNDIPFILSQAEIGVLCSTYEGFPVTLIEYGIYNLVVLSTNVGYCSELIEDGKNGFLFSPDNLTELKEKLIKVCSEDSLRVELKNNYNEHIVNNFSKKAILDKYLKFIKNV